MSARAITDKITGAVQIRFGGETLGDILTFDTSERGLQRVVSSCNVAGVEGSVAQELCLTVITVVVPAAQFSVSQGGICSGDCT